MDWIHDMPGPRPHVSQETPRHPHRLSAPQGWAEAQLHTHGLGRAHSSKGLKGCTSCARGGLRTSASRPDSQAAATRGRPSRSLPRSSGPPSILPSRPPREGAWCPGGKWGPREKPPAPHPGPRGRLHPCGSQAGAAPGPPEGGDILEPEWSSRGGAHSSTPAVNMPDSMCAPASVIPN